MNRPDDFDRATYLITREGNAVNLAIRGDADHGVVQLHIGRMSPLQLNGPAIVHLGAAIIDALTRGPGGDICVCETCAAVCDSGG